MDEVINGAIRLHLFHRNLHTNAQLTFYQNQLAANFIIFIMETWIQELYARRAASVTVNYAKAAFNQHRSTVLSNKLTSMWVKCKTPR